MPTNKLKLSVQAAQIHQQLCQHIHAIIEATGGAIDFSEFMQQALYFPELGYYQNQLRKFGEQGDFVTAPEMGSLFARSIANAIKPEDNDQPSAKNKLANTQILEIGAGSGALAIQLLSELALQQQLPEHYYILEPSGSLQSLQQENIQLAIPQLAERVCWLSHLPVDFCGLIIANEVLDAIPCHQIQRTEAGWQYRLVNSQVLDSAELAGLSVRFEWQLGEVVQSQLLPEPLRNLDDYALGYTTEFRPIAGGWINSLAQCLHTGEILLFDYGYPQKDFYHWQRDSGSLRCFSRHQANSQPLELAGLQDITAHVDFTHIAIAASEAGLSVDGFTTQMGFLLENDILKLAADETHDVNRYRHSQQIQLLTSPGQMGEVVKVMLLTKNTHTSLAGFSLQDHLHRL